MVVSFVKHFRLYLLGTAFILKTDNGPLAWLSNFQNSEGQLARWFEAVQEYNFSIVHQ